MQNSLPNTIQAPDFRAFLADLIGKPYLSGAHGPDKFDCWGLVVFIYRELLGISLPDFYGFESVKAYPRKIEEQIAAGSWVEIKKPEPFCVVAMSRSKVLHHVGVFVDLNGGVCFHAFDGAAVIAESIPRLRASNFSRIVLLKYHGQNFRDNKPAQPA